MQQQSKTQQLSKTALTPLITGLVGMAAVVLLMTGIGYGLANGIQAVDNSAFWTQVNECTIANQTLRNAALNANPYSQHVVTTVDGAVAQDYYTTPRPDPSLAKYQNAAAQARMTAAHCGDNPLVGIAVWANPEPDWSRAAKLPQ